MSALEFQTGVIKPIECLKEGWELIKDQFWLFFLIVFVGMLLFGFSFYILMGTMNCGIYYALFQKARGERMRFEDLFKGFEYFKDSLVASLFFIVPAFVCMIAMYVPMIVMQLSMANQRTADPRQALGYLGVIYGAMFVFYLIFAVLHALMMFTYPLIVEHRLGGFEAVKLSARAVMKNLGGIILFILCEIALVFVGYLLCCIGVYLTIPLMYAGAFMMYRRVFPRNNTPFADNPPPPNAFRGAGNYN